MTQTAPPAAADTPPERPWNFQRKTETDHPTDRAAAVIGRVSRRPDMVDVVFNPTPPASEDPEAVRADDPASIRMQDLEDGRAEQTAATPHPWEAAKQLMDAAKRDNELPPWAADLVTWWGAVSRGDIEGSLKKVVEYGGRGSAYDLLATGHDLAALAGRRVGDEEAAELAIMFYTSSKVNRWFAAAIDGRRPSDDTLLDIAYYAMMARRNRAVGGWPVAPNNTEENHA